MNTKIAILLGLSLILTVNSCKKFNEDTTNHSETSMADEKEIKELTKFLSKEMNLDISKFEFDEQANWFVIDGDMVIPLSDARYRFKHQDQSKQRLGMYTVSNTIAPNITIYIQSNVPAVWVTAINSAIANWNAVDCRVKFQTTTNASTAKISVTSYYSSGVDAAYALMPDGSGNPGSILGVNTYYNTSYSASAKLFAVAHELGHTVGFEHTDETDGTLISQTPVSDPKSVMKHNVSGWEGFSPYDIIAFGVVYPNYPGTSRFLRYYKSGNPDHYFTLYSTDLGAGTPTGYVFENSCGGYFYKTQITGTVPLYRWYRGNPGQHFYTRSNVNIPGYTYEGIAGYVYATQVAGTRPLYRYFRSSAGDHFYTTLWSELGSGANGYVLEGVECYVY